MKKKIAALVALVTLVAGALACAALCEQSPMPVRDVPARASAERLQKHVAVLAKSPRTGAALDAAAAYIKAELGEIPFTTQAVEDSENIIVRFGTRDSERLVVGAHYDTVPSTPGADDNASGVAVIIELARELNAAHDVVPVELVFYTFEEPPYFRGPDMGSAVHAKSVAKDKVRGMISVEMVGYFDDAPDTQHFPSAVFAMRYPDTGNFLAVIGRGDDDALIDEVATGIAVSKRLPIHTAALPTFVEGVDFSDHLNYWAAGMSAVMITDTSFMRNARYHEPSDTPDTLDYARMAHLVDGLRALLTRARPSP